MAEQYLTYSDLIKPDNSLTDAIAALERLGEVYTALTNQIKALSTETRESLKGIDKRTKVGKEQAEALAAEVNEVYAAYLDLVKQQTAVGKSLEFIKNQMAQNRKAYKEEFDLANTIAGSYKNLELRIKDLTNYWKSLSPELAKSQFGQKVKAQIDALTADFNELKTALNPIITEQDKLTAATDRFIEKQKALENVGATWAKAKHDLDEYTRSLTLQYEQQDKLARAREELAWMQDPAGGQEYVRIQQEIQKIKQSLEPVVSEMDKLKDATTKYQEQLAALQTSGVGDAYMQAKADLEAYTKQLKENIEFQRKLAEAKKQAAEIQAAGPLTDTTSGTTTSVYVQEKAELDALNRAQKDYIDLKVKELQADQYEADSYAQKKSRLDALIQKLKLMGDAGTSASNIRAEIANLQKEIADFEKSLKPVVTEQDKLNEATDRYLEKYNALRNAGAAWAQAKHDVDALTASLMQQYEQQDKLAKAKAERDWLTTSEGQEYMRIQQEITAIKDAMKPVVDWQEKLTRATQDYIDKYNAMRAVGDSYIQAKQNLDAYTRSMQEQYELQTKLIDARQRYADIRASIYYDDNVINVSDQYAKEKGELEALNRVNNDYIRLKRIEQQEALYETGSYKQRSLAYQKLTLQIKLMAADTEELRKKKLELTEQARELYFELRREDEAMGNYHRNVGNYNIVWDGLKNSVNQVVRELPSIAVSMNTFFLAISNNIPMLIDEIDKAKERNKELAKAGEKTVPVYKQIAAAIFSWQTALVLVLTILPKYGEQIWEATKEIIRGRKEIIKNTDALKNMSEEVEKNTKEYGKNIINLKKLSYEWKNLTGNREKLQWIKDNKTAFDQMDISVGNVTEAETIFSKNTEKVITAFKLRAKAAVATKLAMDAYGEVVESELKAERYKDIRSGKEEEPGFLQNLWTTATNLPAVIKGWRNGITDLYESVETYSEEAADAGAKNAEVYLKKVKALTTEANRLLSQAGVEAAHKTSETRGPKDLTEIIANMRLKVQKEYEESLTNLLDDELEKRHDHTIDKAEATIRELQNIYRKNERMLKNENGKFGALTQEQIDDIEESQAEITATIANIRERMTIVDTEYARDVMLREAKIEVKRIETQLSGLREGAAAREKLEKDLLYWRQRQVSLENAKLPEAEQVSTEDLDKQFDLEAEDLARKHQTTLYEIVKSGLEQRLGAAKTNTQEELDLQLQALEAERQIALLRNKNLAPERRTNPRVIDAAYTKQGNLLRGQFSMTQLEQQQELDMARAKEAEATELEIDLLTLRHERDRWKQQVQLAKKGMLDWTDTQIKAAEAMIAALDNEINRTGNFATRVGEQGVFGALLEKIGFNDKALDAVSAWADSIIEDITRIVDAEVEAAEAAVSAYEEKVTAAQSAYDAEVEARNNGYANNVATAKKELQQEKKQLAAKQKMLEEAQRRQAAVDSLVQASSLITASANIWSSFSSLGVAGPFLAAAAIAAMWSSFIYSKIRATQLTSQTQEYGEGGLEFLEGGSHASGNDIDLGVQNKRKRRMKAEGGEALAIVNKKNTRKYKRLLPDIINSLNKGNFEDKYLNAFNTGENLALSVNSNTSIDLTKLENDVQGIRKQRETQYFTLPDGTVIVQRKNVRRVIHK